MLATEALMTETLKTADTAGSAYKHWHWTQDQQGIIWLIFNRAEASANTINREVLFELDSILEQLIAEKPKGLVIRSGKSSGFVAGADISEFKDTEPSLVEEIINLGHKVFSKLTALPFTTVAMIEGFCLGGGFELALACNYRVAADDPKTKIGLPEILLGIQPGWGGTVRLPRIVGVFKAMDLILAGKALSARAAAKVGMIDAAVPARHLETAATHYLINKPQLKTVGFWSGLLQLDFIRPFVGKVIKSKVAQKVSAKHYPAPFAIIDNWVDYPITNDAALVQEAKSICKLAATSTAKNLIRVFFLRERLKRLGKQSAFKTRWVHVVGAGVMGGDIAAWCAISGLHVTLEDSNIDAIAKSLARAKELFTKQLKQSHLIQAAQDRLQPDLVGTGRMRADIVIEAIIENITAKQQLFATLEQQVKPDAILATNTSTIPLEEIGSALTKPQRLVGIHFFNPVAKMQLVEVITHHATDEQVKAHALAFVAQIEKLPILVNSAPGFLVNRMLIPYMLESITLLEEGIVAPVIDKAATEFGMPIGPLELVDTIGLDICAHAAEGLHLPIPEVVQQLIAQGHLGKKTGAGFYKYNKRGKPIKPKGDVGTIPADTTDRLIMRIINEGMAVLREGVVTDPDLMDAGMIFGTGFAPFRGGPMCYIEEHKREALRQRLNQLAERYGARFTPDAGWAT